MNFQEPVPNPAMEGVGFPTLEQSPSVRLRGQKGWNKNPSPGFIGILTRFRSHDLWRSSAP